MANQVIHAIVTVALLAFAYLMRHDNPDLSTLVVGLAAGYWFAESKAVAKNTISETQQKFDPEKKP